MFSMDNKDLCKSLNRYLKKLSKKGKINRFNRDIIKIHMEYIDEPSESVINNLKDMNLDMYIPKYITEKHLERGREITYINGESEFSFRSRNNLLV